jgi:hypothetical protein
MADPSRKLRVDCRIVNKAISTHRLTVRHQGGAARKKWYVYARRLNTTLSGLKRSELTSIERDVGPCAAPCSNYSREGGCCEETSLV